MKSVHQRDQIHTVIKSVRIIEEVVMIEKITARLLDYIIVMMGHRKVIGETVKMQLKKNDNDNTNTEVKTTIIENAPKLWRHIQYFGGDVPLEVSDRKLEGSTDGIQQKFNPVRYHACGLYTSADKAYYDGFVTGCMQVGNTKLICETVANSNIVAPPAQTQSTTQPTQAITTIRCESMVKHRFIGQLIYLHLFTCNYQS